MIKTLIVDDDCEILDKMKDLLEGNGHDITIASQGKISRKK